MNMLQIVRRIVQAYEAGYSDETLAAMLERELAERKGDETTVPRPTRAPLLLGTRMRVVGMDDRPSLNDQLGGTN